MPKKFDLYDFLKLKDKSQRLYVENNPHIYIYGDLIINLEYNVKINLVNPDKENFYTQLSCKQTAKGTMFAILDSASNRLYTEALISFNKCREYCREYDYAVYEYDDNGWLIKTHRRNTYVEWVYDIKNNQVIAITYEKDGVEKTRTYHPLDQVAHIIKKNLVVNK